MQPRIDPEFASKIPPLTSEEYRQLEDNILAEGVIINPLITWNGIIVDGHNRFRIVQKHPHIKYTVYKMEFGNRFEVQSWICKNQLGRRNLTPEQRKYLIGKQYEAEKASHGAKDGFRGNQHGKLVSSQNGNLPTHEKTCERIARENNVSKNTVLRAESFSKTVDKADDVSPGIRQSILSGEISLSGKEIEALARADPVDFPMLVEELKQPKPKEKTSSHASKTSPNKTELAHTQKIADDMLHARGTSTLSDVIYELDDALESMMFRWRFCLDNCKSIFGQEACKTEIQKLIRKGFDFMKTIEKGELPK